MPFSRFGLVLAALTASIGLAGLVYFADGYLPRQWPPIALWAVLPALATYWIATRYFRSPAAAPDAAARPARRRTTGPPPRPISPPMACPTL